VVAEGGPNSVSLSPPPISVSLLSPAGMLPIKNVLSPARPSIVNSTTVVRLTVKLPIVSVLPDSVISSEPAVPCTDRTGVTLVRPSVSIVLSHETVLSPTATKRAVPPGGLGTSKVSLSGVGGGPESLICTWASLLLLPTNTR